MANNLKIYSTDGRESSYGIYVNGSKQATVNIPTGYSGNITVEQLQGVSYIDTYIKFGSAPSNANDYDSYVDYMGVWTGTHTYSNETSVYVWGRYGQVTINGQTYESYSGIKTDITYERAIKVDLTGNYEITMYCCAPGGSND